MKELNWSVKTANSIMERLPRLYEDRGYNGKWSYDYGVILKGFEKVWRQTESQKYFNYIKDNMDYFIQKDGSIRGYHLEEYNIDHINNGKLLFVLYKETREEKYKKACDLLRKQFETHPRTSEGAFWHKQIYPYQIWLDGLYMGSPFYAEYQTTFANGKGLEDIILQFKLSYKHLLDQETGLLYHAWDEKKHQPWADKETGLSPNFWGRSIGWYLLAVVDTLEILPEETSGRDFLIQILEQTLQALKSYQDEKNGVWYQVTDKGHEKGNYLEASCSSMYVCAIAKGIRLGVLDRELWEAQLTKSYQGLLDEFVLLTKEGFVNLNKTCQVAGLGGADNRDGSYTYYISEPIICNDQKGLGAFLQALAEFEEVMKEVLK
ncbi:glycoside hydrolase family 88 protein (plasmid) [Niallia taxi]|uniref:glycoside hydrolase family 88/105 protein n=1 Tax=Niallia taxi TaxID=2499688 RepID=UPI0023AA063F|nr:glycoside hydrolase family 88 protein [Niallia taxi]MDE5054572.1 glycoside hydrolase family 88 protein [Niallia taxi]WOD65918.1 glycoside hydrolase family 88 protein [Niallia taxi]